MVLEAGLAVGPVSAVLAETRHRRAQLGGVVALDAVGRVTVALATREIW